MMFQNKIALGDAVVVKTRQKRESAVTLQNEEVRATRVEMRYLGTPAWKTDGVKKVIPAESKDHICMILMDLLREKNLTEIARNAISEECFSIAHYLKHISKKGALTVQEGKLFELVISMGPTSTIPDPFASRFWFSRALLEKGYISGRENNVNIKPTISMPNTKEILQVIEEFTNVPPERVRSSERDRIVSDARFKAIYTIRNISTLSLSQIGRCLGDRDHTTILNGIVQVKRKIESDAGRMKVIMRICNVADTVGAQRGFEFLKRQS